MPTDEDTPVIPIRGETTEDAGVRILPAPPVCLHWRFGLHEETRRVTCGRCGREVDAFDALMSLSLEVDRYVHRLERLKGDERLVQARVDDLRRQERNVKARVRRLKAGDDPTPRGPRAPSAVLLRLGRRRLRLRHHGGRRLGPHRDRGAGCQFL